MEKAGRERTPTRSARLVVDGEAGPVACRTGRSGAVCPGAVGCLRSDWPRSPVACCHGHMIDTPGVVAPLGGGPHTRALLDVSGRDLWRGVAGKGAGCPKFVFSRVRGRWLGYPAWRRS